jgi:uncharacterized protein YtpQ (UPF0354 family)
LLLCSAGARAPPRCSIDTLLPVLRAADWPERSGCVHGPLLEGLPAPDLPIVTITQQVEPLLVFLGPERLAWLGISAAEAQSRAVANLARLPIAWRTVQSATPSGGWLELQVHEGSMAAERILDRGALEELARDRIDGHLALGIPHSGILLATAASGALEGAFSRVVRGLYDEVVAAGGPALSPRVFLAQQGRLAGLLA